MIQSSLSHHIQNRVSSGQIGKVGTPNPTTYAGEKLTNQPNTTVTKRQPLTPQNREKTN